ncbi:cell division suppressor protein YneA [Peribacillus glennii]|uniref:LysM peptidoglycan-binding domain-containing protein n=1 Tax=Peribacillus glennii TaxID=2303991 RepID=A0A372L9H6_9BACI|nr:LysM peptidoglycan-binding domain-containing protein [Peribacillus glennii]RFU61229.1 LysM peptidoglycan-binding domain-containing protein [Peribacillus glennii]
MKTLFRKHSYTILLLGVVFIFSLLLSLKSEQENLDNYQSVKVASGETLWQLAERYETVNLSRTDFISWIEEQNDISAESLQPGDRIFIPIEKNAAIHNLASE